MPSHNDPVRPIPFEAVSPAPSPGAAASTANSVTARGTPAWVLPAMGMLLLLATLVLFLVPGVLLPPEKGTGTPPGETSAGEASEPVANTAPATVQRNATGAPGKRSPEGADASPWSDAQQARARREAQDVLQPLLDLQFALQERGVEQWADAEFTRVKALATEGDTLYKNRQYADALARYKEGLGALQALEKSMPQVLEKWLAQARHALDNGDAASAGALLATAALIAPDNAEIAKLQQRAAVLPQVLPLLEQARAAEASGDLAQAQTLLQQAVTLDPQHAVAQADLKRVSASLSNRGFNAAMSEGYAALKAGQFDSARKAFGTAAKLQPGSAEAASALKEVASVQTAQRLTALERQGVKDEQQEQWQKAVATYEQARKIDSGVLFASEGLRRSQARAQLDKQLRTAVDDPLRLSEPAIAAATWTLLAEAKLVAPRGPVLAEQINRLENVLRQAETKIDVTLRSDNATDVTVYKVAKLGRFQEKALELRPGAYTAVGTRDGYRDVRQNFTVTHDAAPAPVTVVCTERI
jgi:tetratricopeptide (TPR) repeat protein